MPLLVAMDFVADRGFGQLKLDCAVATDLAVAVTVLRRAGPEAEAGTEFEADPTGP